MRLLSLACTHSPFGCTRLWLAQPYFFFLSELCLTSFICASCLHSIEAARRNTHGKRRIWTVACTPMLDLDTVVRRHQTAIQRYNKNHTFPSSTYWERACQHSDPPSDGSVWLVWGSSRPLEHTVYSQIILTNNCRHNFSQSLWMCESLGPFISCSQSNIKKTWTCPNMGRIALRHTEYQLSLTRLNACARMRILICLNNLTSVLSSPRGTYW